MQGRFQVLHGGMPLSSARNEGKEGTFWSFSQTLPCGANIVGFMRSTIGQVCAQGIDALACISG